MTKMNRIKRTTEDSNHAVTPGYLPATRQSGRQRLLANMAVSQYPVFLRSQSFQADRATNVYLVRTDADFRTQAVFKAVGKPRRCVNHD